MPQRPVTFVIKKAVKPKKDGFLHIDNPVGACYDKFTLIGVGLYCSRAVFFCTQALEEERCTFHFLCLMGRSRQDDETGRADVPDVKNEKVLVIRSSKMLTGDFTWTRDCFICSNNTNVTSGGGI